MQRHLDQRWSFTTRSDLVVVGSNPENADVTNPRGESFGLLWYVQGSNEHGDTAELAVISSTEPSAIAAAKLATRLNARVTDLKRLPVGFDLWPEGRPIYGSDAYVEYGQADDLALEAREADDERWARIGG